MNMQLQEQLAACLSSPAVGENLLSMAALSGAGLSIHDTDGEELHRSLPDSMDSIEGLVTVETPLQHLEHNIGTLHLFSTRGKGELTLLGEAIGRTLLEVVNHEYEMDNLSLEILSKYEELNVLYDVGESLDINMNQEEICRLAVDKVQQVVGAGKTVALLQDDDQQSLLPVADSGYGDQGFAADTVQKQQLVLAQHVTDNGKALLVDHREGFPPELCQRLSRSGDTVDGLWPILAAPIKRGENLLGVLLATDKSGGLNFTANDLKLVMAICSQAAVAITNLNMVEALKKTEALKREMDIARNIQIKMLPSQPISLDTLTVAGRCVTAANVGGDYYDHIHIADESGTNDDLIHLLIADVSGHDVGAALMMSVGRKVFHTAVRQHLDPAGLMREFNSVMHDDLSSSDLFITMFYAQYRHSRRTLHFSNAGHNPPFLVRANDGSIVTMDSDGMIVGVLEDLEFEAGEVSLNPGDLAVFYTDGVVEAENPEGEQYGLDRFHRLVKQHLSETPEKLLDIIYDSVKTFSGSTSQYDDVTVMILKDSA